jgi:hypothetical protein
MLKLVDILATCVAAVVVFFAINLIHFNYFQVDVVFFSCLIDIALTGLIVGPAAYWVLSKRKTLTQTEMSLTGMLIALSLVFYSVMGPTVIDRSLSFYLVEKLRLRGGEIAYNAFPEIFVKEYIPEYRLMDVRLQEQFSSGFAEYRGDCVVLTDKGRFVAGFMDFFRRNMLPKKRNLLGEITDKLTHPFDGAKQVVDTTCSDKTPR